MVKRRRTLNVTSHQEDNLRKAASSLPQQDDCKTCKDTMSCTTKRGPNFQKATITGSHNKINNNMTSASEHAAAEATVGNNCILLKSKLRPNSDLVDKVKCALIIVVCRHNYLFFLSVSALVQVTCIQWWYP